MSQINLSISQLHKAYSNGELSPATLIKQLTEQANQQEAVWLHVLSAQELAPYLKALESKSLETHPLYGVPFAIKDNIDLAGIPTTAACPEFTYTPENSAFVVEQLIAAGAIPIGKTNLDQFATGLVGTRSPFGETPNAFNPDYISGGSSSGSAVATASGMVSFALGTDTAGSGRVPACFNNLVGVKPSKGLLSNTGMVPACKSIDCMSIFALDATDANKVLQVAAKYDPQDSYSRKNPPANQQPVIVKHAFNFAVPLPEQLNFFGDEGYKNEFVKAVNELQNMGGVKKELDFSPLFEAATLLYEGPWVSERYLATQHLIENNPQALLDVTRTIISGGIKPLAIDCFSALYKLQAFKQQADLLVSQADFVVTPTAGRHFTRSEVREKPIELNSQLGYYTNFMNLLDYSAVAVPTSFTANSMPFGVTLFSFAMEDQKLLGYANKIMQHNALPLGATKHPFIATELDTSKNTGFIDIAVCGAHLSGMPLNSQLIERDAKLVTKTRSAKCYKMFAIKGSIERPALVKAQQNANDFELEVWRMPSEHFASFVQGISDPLGIGQVTLADESQVTGFIAQSHAQSGKDISEYGSWRKYIAAK